MKTTKLILLLFMLVFAAASLNAQDSDKASDLLQQSLDRMRAVQDYRAVLTMIVSHPDMNAPIVKNGNVLVSGKQAHLMFPEQEVIMNEQYVWVILYEGPEIVKTNARDDDLNQVSLFQVMQSPTTLRYDGKDGDLEKITLFFNTPDSDIIYQIIWINTDWLIVKNKTLGRNGTMYEYQMQNHQLNTGTTDADFTVDLNSDKYKEYVLTDLTEN
jgi:outer membrane lipoprotein-sorting protein